MTSTRLITAFIAMPALYFYIMHLSAGWLAVLVAIISAWSQIEFYSMYKVRSPFAHIGITIGLIIIAGMFYYGDVTTLLIISVLAVMTTRLFGIKDPASSLSDVAPVLTGIIYVPLLMGMMIPLRLAGPEWIIYLMTTIWGADAFAYFIGKGIGKRKLYPSMSPNKTVAGAVGSFIGGMTGAVVIKTLLIPTLSARDALITGAVVGGVTIVGDLVESMFKRDAGVKDSGSLIPGHGGMLDKIDGALFAAPALYWVLLLLGSINPRIR